MNLCRVMQNIGVRNRLNRVMFSMLVNMVMLVIECIFVLVLCESISGMVLVMKVMDVIMIGCSCRWQVFSVVFMMFLLFIFSFWVNLMIRIVFLYVRFISIIRLICMNMLLLLLVSYMLNNVDNRVIGMIRIIVSGSDQFLYSVVSIRNVSRIVIGNMMKVVLFCVVCWQFRLVYLVVMFIGRICLVILVSLFIVLVEDSICGLVLLVRLVVGQLLKCSIGFGLKVCLIVIIELIGIILLWLLWVCSLLMFFMLLWNWLLVWVIICQV